MSKPRGQSEAARATAESVGLRSIVASVATTVWLGTDLDLARLDAALASLRGTIELCRSARRARLDGDITKAEAVDDVITLRLRRLDRKVSS